MNPDSLLILPRAILFDMDGTLTAPLLDFDALKREMGIAGKPILEALQAMDLPARRLAQQILHRHEHKAASQSTLNPGCVELLNCLKQAHIATAVITRNSRQSVDTVFRRHRLHFDVCITREDGKFKPDPAPLLLACQRLNVDPIDAWMVGDSYHDVDAGIAANIRTVWISHGSKKEFASKPWRTVRGLIELLELINGGSRRV